MKTYDPNDPYYQQIKRVWKLKEQHERELGVKIDISPGGPPEGWDALEAGLKKALESGVPYEPPEPEEGVIY